MVRAPRLIVTHPDSHLKERRYITETIVGDFLGLEYVLRPSAGTCTVISVEGDQSSKKLVLDDVFLQMPEDWLSYTSLPTQPLEVWRVACDLPEARVLAPEIQVIYGRSLQSNRAFEQTDEGIRLSLDVFGSAFFMLTRYEEVVKTARDEHDRFSAALSLAHKEGFLERPIIDEYVEILWACLQRLWPRLERKKHEYRLTLTHDVDHPLACLGQSLPQVLRSSIGDLIRRNDVSLAVSRLHTLFRDETQGFDKDPYNTFEFLMDISERNSVRSTFYFITAGSDEMGSYYPVEMSWITNLMKTMHSRGHEIGLHSSYGSYLDEQRIQAEFGKLMEIVGRLGIVQSRWGNRQHYLRWRTPVTWRLLDEAGVDYDATLSYADHVGFRCGVCREFAVYDVVNRCEMRIREKPLIAMDVSLTDPRYMRLPQDDIPRVLSELARCCKVVCGEFTLLYHNNTLITESAKRLYAEIVNACR
jgi:hypothetical protein